MESRCPALRFGPFHLAYPMGMAEGWPPYPNSSLFSSHPIINSRQSHGASAKRLCLSSVLRSPQSNGLFSLHSLSFPFWSNPSTNERESCFFLSLFFSLFFSLSLSVRVRVRRVNLLSAFPPPWSSRQSVFRESSFALAFVF